MFKRYPFVKQLGITDCGAASLSMIIKYHKGNIPTHIIREEIKTTRKGVSAYNIIKYGKEIGFDSKGIKCELNYIKNIPKPFIAHVTIDNLDHFIVVYETNNKYWLVADPSDKIKKITIDEINKIWNKTILTFLPENKIPYVKDINLRSFIYKLFKLNKKDFLKMIYLSVLVTIFGITSSFMFQTVIDYLTNTRGINDIRLIILFFLSINIFKIITEYFKKEVLIIANQKMDILLTLSSFKNIILLPYHYYHNRKTGEILSRINDISTLRELISVLFSALFIDVLLSVSAFICIFIINKTLAIVALIMFLLYLLIIILFSKTFNELVDKIKRKEEIVNSYMIENISGFETVKGNTIEKKVILKFNRLYNNFLKEFFKYDRLNNIQKFLKDLVYEVGLLIIIYLSVLMILDNKFTLASLLTFNALLSYFLSPIQNIVEYNALLREGKISLKRILEIFESKKDHSIFNNVNGNIQINNLNFSYQKELVLNNINLSLDNKYTMVIGDSGSGKSTLFKILNKYYKVNRGCIKIGDIDINDLDALCIRKYVSYISQNEVIFSDTIYNNIILEGDYKKEEVIKVVKACLLEDVINKKEYGLSTLLEENGFNLSGGEKQRIFLARALLRKPKYLIIDEGMSEMNNDLERKIIKNIMNYYKDINLIMISHRLNNMDLFDRVIKFNKGEIIDDIRKC
jgi:ATP-binding cassette subfamily B protein